MKTFVCHNCGQSKPVSTSGGTGYATTKGGKLCYACCAIGDALTMVAEDAITLYFHGGKISNWPGSLTFAPSLVTQGRHNICRTQTTVRFRAFGRNWTGRQYGGAGDLLRCKAVR